MADSSNVDMLMYVVSKTAGMVAAESTSQLVAGDKLTSDFQDGKYFEAENFSFSIKLEDDEGKGTKKPAPKVPGKPESTTAAAEEDRRETRSYERWRAINQDGVTPTPPYRAEPEDFGITRMIDSSSPILLQHCLDVQRFEKAVIVKRTRSPKTGTMAGFLRMEFEKVYLKSIEWTDGDAVKESCKFKFASVKVTYVKRKPDGTPASSWPCNWDPTINA